MAKYERFSTVLESPNMLEVGQSILLKSGKRGIITSISKVEYITSRLVLINGNSKIVNVKE